MEPNEPAFVQKASGVGPRHLTFHPFLNVMYVVNELASSVTAYRLDPDSGLLTEFQELSSVPADYEGRLWSADIEVTPNGKFLYASNRAIDTLAGYEVNQETGELALIGFTDTEQTPRDFGVDPTGRFLYAGGQDSNKLAAFRIDPDTGALERFATYDAESGPQWVMPLFFPEEIATEPARLSITRNENGGVIVAWDSRGTLKSSPSVDGEYGIVEGAESPYEVHTEGSGFYLLERD
jgi:6-phosphogluconolactonase